MAAWSCTGTKASSGRGTETGGATDEEMIRQFPGDDLVPDPSDETPRAVTVNAPADAVWPWIVQLGQGRGGFYRYSWLENLAGADIHNVDHIIPELQDLEKGDSIRMVREDYWLQSPSTAMTVKRIDSDRTLVLRGTMAGYGRFTSIQSIRKPLASSCVDGNRGTEQSSDTCYGI